MVTTIICQVGAMIFTNNLFDLTNILYVFLNVMVAFAKALGFIFNGKSVHNIFDSLNGKRYINICCCNNVSCILELFWSIKVQIVDGHLDMIRITFIQSQKDIHHFYKTCIMYIMYVICMYTCTYCTCTLYRLYHKL